MTSVRVPPVVQALLHWNLGNARTDAGLRRKLVGLTRALRADAEWTRMNFAYYGQATPPEGVLTLASPAMSPFSFAGKCAHIECRGEATLEFARSTVLFTDTVLVPDPVTLLFAGDPHDIDIHEFCARFVALRTLAPLIEAGVVLFSRPVEALCAACFRKSQKSFTRALDASIETLGRGVSSSWDGREIVVDLAGFFGRPLSWSFAPAAEEVEQLEDGSLSPGFLARRDLRDILFRDLSLLVQHLQYARDRKAILMTNSRAETEALNGLARRRQARYQVGTWEPARTITLPWVNGISMTGLVRLRNEAGSALPRLRRLLARIADERAPGDAETALANTVSDLRDEALHAEDELRRILRRRVFRGALGVAGMTLFTTALVAPAGPVPAALALAALLAHVHSEDEHDRAVVANLRASPAYVLLKARDIAKRYHMSGA